MSVYIFRHYSGILFRDFSTRDRQTISRQKNTRRKVESVHSKVIAEPFYGFASSNALATAQSENCVSFARVNFARFIKLFLFSRIEITRDQKVQLIAERCRSLTRASTDETYSYRQNFHLAYSSRLRISDANKRPIRLIHFESSVSSFQLMLHKASRRGMRWYANRVRDFGIPIVSRAISQTEVTEITVHRSVHDILIRIIAF